MSSWSSIWVTPRRAYASTLALLVLAGCDLPGKPDPAKKFVPPSEIKDFAALFQKNCSGCHGKDGKLGPAPPLHDPVFLAIVPEKELVKVISGGRVGTSMPSFAKDQGGTLTAAQIDVLAKGLKTTWGKSGADPKSWPAYLAPAEKGDKDRGRKVFAKACASCHGQDGLGTDTIGAIHDPAFLSLSSEQVLRRLIISGRPDLGMPNCAARDGRSADFTPLTATDVNDLVALLMSWKQPAQPKR